MRTTLIPCTLREFKRSNLRIKGSDQVKFEWPKIIINAVNIPGIHRIFCDIYIDDAVNN